MQSNHTGHFSEIVLDTPLYFFHYYIVYFSKIKEAHFPQTIPDVFYPISADDKLSLA